MRTYMILKALVDNQDYLPINFFMQKLKVSKRTVQSELSYLKRVGDQHGYNLTTAYGKGYILEQTDHEAVRQFLNNLMSTEVVTEQEELIFDIISILLAHGSGYTTVSELAERFGLSNTLLYAKMETIAEYLNSYKLILERKSHYGIRIQGDSKAIRKLMLDFYLKGDNSFHELVKKRVGNFGEYERIVEDDIRKNNLRIGYYEYQVLLSWLKVLIVDELINHAATKPTATIPSQTEKIMDNTGLSDVLLHIQMHFKIFISPDVISEFNKLVQKSAQKDDQPGILTDKEKIKDDLVAFFATSDSKSRTNYSHDTEFITQLARHISFLLDRLDHKITYKNPLLLEFCIRYPLVFDTVLRFSNFLEVKYGYEISNDELGFIAVHFLNHTQKEQNERINHYDRIAILCTTGGGVSNLIRTQIQTIFPYAVIETFSFWEEVDLNRFKPNLVFSAVPLKHTPNVPTLYINELLSPQDITNIKQALFIEDFPELNSVEIKDTRNWLSLIKPELFSVSSAETYLELLDKTANEIQIQGYGDDHYRQNVKLREKYMSTVYKNGLALPHPIEMCGRRSAIAVTIVKPELSVDKRPVRIVFMICLSKKDFHYYSNISNGLFQLMQNDYKIIEICHDPSYQNVINTLKGLEG